MNEVPTGYFGPRLAADRAALPPREPTLAILTEAISELNRTLWTETDAQMAFELERILARRGMKIVAAGLVEQR